MGYIVYLRKGNIHTAPVGIPKPIEGLSATGTSNKITVSWTAPTDKGWYNTVIVMSSDHAPTSITDGTEIYRGTGTSVTKTGLSYSTTYYFAAFAVDSKGQYRTTGYPTVSCKTADIVYFFNAGDACSSVTGGWKQYSSWIPGTNGSSDSAGTAYFKTSGSNLVIYGDSDGWNNRTAGAEGGTVNKIDMTGLSTITFVVNVYRDSPSNGFESTVGISSNQSGFYRSTDVTKSGTYTVDVSDITGSYYIMLYMDTHSGQSSTSTGISSVSVSSIRGV